MQELELYIRYFTKMSDMIKIMFTKPLGIVLAIPAVTLPMLTTPQKTLLLLGGLFIGDFITGIMASWVEFQKAKPVVPASGKRYVLSSAKLRLSAVKFITYAMGVIVAFGLESIFVIREFEPSDISTQGLTLTTIVTLFFCCIEFYSIFFENIKRMGFDIIQMVKNIFKEGWGVYKSVKDDDTNKE